MVVAESGGEDLQRQLGQPIVGDDVLDELATAKVCNNVSYDW